MSSKKWSHNNLEFDFWTQATKEIKKQQLSEIIGIGQPLIIHKMQQPDYKRNLNSKELVLNDNSNIDRCTINRLKKGDYKIDGTLDLHGYTLIDAVQKFEEFILRAWQLKKRLLLVITGKGTGESSIRNMITKWINNRKVCQFVLRIGVAHTKHGGMGAFYVLLKRDRKSEN